MPGELDVLRGRLPAMVDDLGALVAAESPSSDLDALAAAREVVVDVARPHLGVEPERVEVEGRVHLRWVFGSLPASVVLLGHYDTVHPLGSLGSWPFAVEGGRATGPGVFDMKAGLVQAFHALSTLDDLDGIALVVDCDEEIGSRTSRALLEQTAAGAGAALVLEPSAPGGELKTARKGVSNYTVSVTGRAAHAGLEPELGVNALVELAHQIERLDALDDLALGTTVTPTVAAAGTTTNTVPAAASVEVDVRAVTIAEQARVDAAVRALVARHPEARLDVAGGPNRPPMEPASSAWLFDLARRVASDLGLAEPAGVHVGGGSDGNFTAAMGVPTLDGLGAVGGGAHARTEHVLVDTMPERSALLAGLVDAVRSGRA